MRLPSRNMSTPLTDLELLARLISFDTTSSRSNRACAEFVCAYLDQPGIALEQFVSDDAEKVTVLARVGRDPGADRAGLMLSGHLDVVPATEPEWTSDPFALKDCGETLVARGSCDMKGFDALAINRLRRAAEAQAPPTLWLLLSADEEIGSLGVKTFARDWPEGRPLPREVLVGEPTSLQPVRMHKGHLKLRLTVRGRSAHSGSPHLGDNAIERMIPVLVALESLRTALRDERGATSGFFGDVPFVALTLARLTGGVAFNVIPDGCTLDIGLRLLPGSDGPAMIERVRQVLAECGPVEIEAMGENPPLLTADDTPLLATLNRCLASQTGPGMDFSSDGGVLARDLDCACVLFGPGDIRVAHRPDEFLPRAEWERAGTVLDTIIAELEAAP